MPTAAQLRTESSPEIDLPIEALHTRTTGQEMSPAGTAATAWSLRSSIAPLSEASEPAQEQKGVLQEHVDGVVQALLEDAILFNCQVGNRQTTIQLPTELVPDGLRSFGAPVRISLRNARGVRIPVVEPRTIAVKSDGFVEEFRAWMERD